MAEIKSEYCARISYNTRRQIAFLEMAKNDAIEEVIQKIITVGAFLKLTENLWRPDEKLRNGIAKKLLKFVEDNPQYNLTKVGIAQPGYGTFAYPFDVPFYQYVVEYLTLDTIEMFLKLEPANMESLDMSDFNEETVNLFKKYAKE